MIRLILLFFIITPVFAAGEYAADYPAQFDAPTEVYYRWYVETGSGYGGASPDIDDAISQVCLSSDTTCQALRRQTIYTTAVHVGTCPNGSTPIYTGQWASRCNSNPCPSGGSLNQNMCTNVPWGQGPNPSCPSGKKLVEGACVIDCPTSNSPNPEGTMCVPDVNYCIGSSVETRLPTGTTASFITTNHCVSGCTVSYDSVVGSVAYGSQTGATCSWSPTGVEMGNAPGEPVPASTPVNSDTPSPDEARLDTPDAPTDPTASDLRPTMEWVSDSIVGAINHLREVVESSVDDLKAMTDARLQEVKQQVFDTGEGLSADITALKQAVVGKLSSISDKTGQSECDKSPGSTACTELGSLDSNDDPEALNKDLGELNLGTVFTAGSCPADKTFTAGNHTVTVPMTGVCQAAQDYVKPFVLLTAAIGAYMIFVGGLKGG